MAVESFSASPAGPLIVARRPATRLQAQFPLLSIVVPTYNEAANIGPFLEAIRAGLDSAASDNYEVIVVDDESPDGTGEVATAISSDWPNLRVVRRAGERGLASAVGRLPAETCWRRSTRIFNTLPRFFRKCSGRSKMRTWSSPHGTRRRVRWGDVPYTANFCRHWPDAWGCSLCPKYSAGSPTRSADVTRFAGKPSRISSYGPPDSKR